MYNVPNWFIERVHTLHILNNPQQESRYSNSIPTNVTDYVFCPRLFK